VKAALGLATSSTQIELDCGFRTVDGLVVDRDYEDKAPYAFTGTVKEVVFDLKPAAHEAEMALHAHAAVQAVGQGAAG
jgi:arylsulfatase